jgi:predicted helicase
LIGEIAPDGGKDENVFDIRQGVAITILVNSKIKSTKSTIYYKDIHGSRDLKYQTLLNTSLSSINWETITPATPYFFFVPKNFNFYDEFSNYRNVENILRVNISGVKTHRDSFVIGINYEAILNRFSKLNNEKFDDRFFMENFSLKNTMNWNFSEARESFKSINDWDKNIYSYYYRPFDIRWIYYSSIFVERSRQDVMHHMLKQNIALLTMRQVVGDDFRHVFVSSTINDMNILTSHHVSQVSFPLYLYPENPDEMLFDSTATSPWEPDPDHGNRVPNLDPGFVAEMEEKLGLTFDPHLSGREHPIETALGPEDVLAYIYAVFHSPTYRERYAEFLKIDFPRVPLTDDAALFRTLVAKGRQLLSLHLMESPKLNERLTHYPIPGDDVVAPRGGYPKYTPPEGDAGGRVFINREQYFEGVPPAVWSFEIGGYQVLHKWLKDRRGRNLSYDERDHYQQVVVALSETMRLMEEIDAAIPAWPL